MIRDAALDDLEALRVIEVRAGRIFADFGLAEVAGHEAPPADVLAKHQRAGMMWVADDEAGAPIAYLVAEPVDGTLHIKQVSVDPDHARRGLGRDLIEYAAGWGAEHGYPSLTLTTFVELPWNGPYYERLGFRYLADDEVTPGLRAIRQAEADFGLDKWPRACMIRPL